VEVIGVPSTNVVRNARIDPDSGRFRVSRSAPHLHAFRTPSVRNVELTAPYMHNGVYATLEQVVDFYNRGGGVGIGAVLDNQTLPPDTLGLSAREQAALVGFMRALTDTARVTGSAEADRYRQRLASAPTRPRP
jgi:cytochrome c peroxidase